MDKTPVSRRQALARLGMGIFAAYALPEMLTLSQAAASTTPTPPTEPTQNTEPTVVSEPTTPEPEPSEPSTTSDPSAPEASLPSGPEQEDWREDNACGVHQTRGKQVTISNSDFRRAQRAVARGEALPLNDVYGSVQQHVRGQLLEVQFNDSGVPPIYRFRIVSENGRLVTVYTDALSAEILRILNC